ncbi:MAG: EI24 domain-containing protein [Bdellovibrio sp.]
MIKIMRSFRLALLALVRLKMILLIVGPPFLAVTLLLGVFLYFGSAWVGSLTSFLSGLSILQWMQSWNYFHEFMTWTSVIFVILFFFPLAFVTSIFLTSLVVVPVALPWILRVDYPHLEKKRGGSIVGSVVNTIVATGVFLFLFVITTPLWLVPGCQVMVPAALSAWLNKKVFLYDVLQDVASKEERLQIEKQESLPMYGMGFLLGLLSYIPLAFLVVPVISALCYIYYALEEVSQRRRSHQ